MAQAKTTKAAATGKRESGYAITLRGWLPVDPQDVASFKATLDLIQQANGGDYGDLLKLMQRTEFAQKFTTRAKVTA